MKRLALTLSMVLAALSTTANASDVEDQWKGKTVYNQVNLRFAGKKSGFEAFSTNFTSVAKLYVVGSKFKVTDVSSDTIELGVSGLSVPLTLNWVSKHTQIPLAEYIARTFSLTPVALPAELSAKEKECIEQGRPDAGISRRALFLAIGYPPANLNPSFEAKSLIYQYTRWTRFTVHFDDKNLVSRIEGQYREEEKAEPPKTPSREGKTVYNKVNFRAKFEDPMYHAWSTNYISLAKLFPVNTKFVVKSQDDDSIELIVPPANTKLLIDYEPKHSQMPFDEYLQTMFSDKPVTLPANLTAQEKRLITAGLVEPGISREALFLAVGYPPGNLNPSLAAGKLIYMTLPAQKSTVTFDAKGKVKTVN